MVDYIFKKNSFVIKDYQRAKQFANFLPAVAGKLGIPLWAFYTNMGQAMGGFGIGNRENAISPFESALVAYQNIPTKGFRTFLKIDQYSYQPFSNPHKSQTMTVGKSFVKITEAAHSYKIEITYSTISNQKYPGLIRKVTITNTSKKEHNFAIIDGLSVFLPKGFNNQFYRDLPTLMASYCQITNFENKAPYAMFNSSTNDNAKIDKVQEGNVFFSLDENNSLLNNIVDPTLLFGQNINFSRPINLETIDQSDFIKQKQQKENIIPSAYSYKNKTLKSKQSYSFITVFTSFKDIFLCNKVVNNLSFNKLNNMIFETEELIDGLLSPMEVHTSSLALNKYFKQCFFDNGLRGGFPILLSKNNPYYIYSRKHGDMERDYNVFDISASYFSSGMGNFRDINQNRRNDLYFYPFLQDYNIHLFYSLLQIDGNNPLTIRPMRLIANTKYMTKNSQTLDKEISQKLIKLCKSYYPGELFCFLQTNCKNEYQKMFDQIVANSKQDIDASFSEGYWVDHFSYNLDLIENYLSIYPDKLEDLLLKDKYRYFYSPVYVKPRSEKYCLVEDKIRQYNATNADELKKNNEDINSCDWLRDENGKIVEVNLLNKLINLVLLKFSSLDPEQIGIEMDSDKPGWNDALNGLPGLIGSSVSETIELLRVLIFLTNSIEKLDIKEIALFSEQYELFISLNIHLNDLLDNKISSFCYWDNCENEKEKFRVKVRQYVNHNLKYLPIDELKSFLDKAINLLKSNINNAKVTNNGIIPTYFYFEPISYQKTGFINELGYETVKVNGFNKCVLPNFLEASARALKIKELLNHHDVEKVKSSDLYDKKLNIYKTSDDLSKTSFEVGRITSFSKGWLERESDFLHMTYKYLLGLLKSGYYEDFYQEAKTNLTCFMNPKTYGRNPLENSSFIVPSNNENSYNHGRGFLARLTGANAEVLNMFSEIFVGESLFSYENNVLTFHLKPRISLELFDTNDCVSFKLFNKILITYHNPHHINLLKDDYKLLYKIKGNTYNIVNGQIAQSIRNLKIHSIDVEII